MIRQGMRWKVYAEGPKDGNPRGWQIRLVVQRRQILSAASRFMASLRNGER